MLLTILRRADARWIVLPAVLRAPTALMQEGELERVGCVDIEFGRLTEGLALGIALRGFGVAEARDEFRMRAAMARDDGRIDPTRL